MRDKHTIRSLNIFMAQNDGWIAVSENSETGLMRETLGAFTNKKELLKWLDENLKYASTQWEDDKKEEPDA